MKKKKEPTEMQLLAQQLFGKAKDKSDVKEILSELYKQGIEAILKAELDQHLEHDKHEESPDGNYRNGSSKKTVKSSIGDLALNIPRDRHSTFSPIAIPKHERMIDKIDRRIGNLQELKLDVQRGITQVHPE